MTILTLYPLQNVIATVRVESVHVEVFLNFEPLPSDGILRIYIGSAQNFEAI